MQFTDGVFLTLVGLGAGFVQRVSGFGLGIFSMMFLPFFLPSHTAAATISTLFSCVTSSYNTIRYRKQVAYKTVLPMLCAALVTIPIAVCFSGKVPAATFRQLLGLVLVLLSIYFMFFSKNFRVAPTRLNGTIAGALGGALGGLFSTGGPPAVLYLSSTTNDNITYFASIQFYFCFTNLYTTATRLMNGMITTEILIYAMIGIIGCMTGDLIGRVVFQKLNSSRLKQIIYIGMIISGGTMLF